MDFNVFNEIEFEMTPIIKNKLDLMLTELNVLFGTSKGRIFCNRKFGQQLENYLWDTTYNTEYIRSQCILEVEENCAMTEYFDVSIDFNVVEGVSRDIGILSIKIKDKGSEVVISNPQWVFK